MLLLATPPLLRRRPARRSRKLGHTTGSLFPSGEQSSPEGAIVGWRGSRHWTGRVRGNTRVIEKAPRATRALLQHQAVRLCTRLCMPRVSMDGRPLNTALARQEALEVTEGLARRRRDGCGQVPRIGRGVHPFRATEAPCRCATPLLLRHRPSPQPYRCTSLAIEPRPCRRRGGGGCHEVPSLRRYRRKCAQHQHRRGRNSCFRWCLRPHGHLRRSGLRRGRHRRCCGYGSRRRGCYEDCRMAPTVPIHTTPADFVFRPSCLPVCVPFGTIERQGSRLGTSDSLVLTTPSFSAVRPRQLKHWMVGRARISAIVGHRRAFHASKSSMLATPHLLGGTPTVLPLRMPGLTIKPGRCGRRRWAPAAMTSATPLPLPGRPHLLRKIGGTIVEVGCREPCELTHDPILLRQVARRGELAANNLTHQEEDKEEPRRAFTNERHRQPQLLGST
mmetsp:Transcript_8508/g.18108  ORF Transcript_8508/g.18108 Transcript_8508/m.18108 type:complete len:446 (-) Transcript_8508:101-1438(-)